MRCVTIRRVKRTLADSIKKLAAEKQLFSRNPGKDNTRNRKLPFEKVVAAILSFQGGTLNRELMDFFDLNSASPTTSAFVQQRAKILPAAFESLFHHFTDRICEQKTYNGYRLLQSMVPTCKSPLILKMPTLSIRERTGRNLIICCI